MTEPKWTMAVFSATLDQFRYWANQHILENKDLLKWEFNRSRSILKMGDWIYQHISRRDQLLGLTIHGYTTWGQPPRNLSELEEEAGYRMQANPKEESHMTFQVPACSRRLNRKMSRGLALNKRGLKSLTPKSGAKE